MEKNRHMAASPTFAPVTMTLYDQNDEPITTLTKSVIRWGVLKRALKLATLMEESKGSESGEHLDALTAFVCELFDDKVTQAELEAGADIGEVMACFKAVMHRASALGNG